LTVANSDILCCTPRCFCARNSRQMPIRAGAAAKAARQMANIMSTEVVMICIQLSIFKLSDYIESKIKSPQRNLYFLFSQTVRVIMLLYFLC
jgi:hypothetical protein